ncbi:hypothetical protein [Aeromonas veronii]
MDFITSSDSDSHAREAPSEIQLTVKVFTQSIDRNNVMPRSRIKQ